MLIAQLGEELFGIYGVVGSSMVLAGAFSALGMGIIIARDVARAPERAGEYWSAALAMQTALAALAYPLMVLAAGLGEFEQQSLVQGYLALVGINLFLDCFGNIGKRFAVGARKVAAIRRWSRCCMLLRWSLWVAAPCGWVMVCAAYIWAALAHRRCERWR